MVFSSREATHLLHRCTTLVHLYQAHALLLKSSLDRDLFLIGALLRRCFSLSSPHSLSYGLSLFSHLPNPDPFLWNTLISAFLRFGHPSHSLFFFRQMRQSGATLDSFSASLAAQASAAARNPSAGASLHSLQTKLGFSQDLFVQTALVEMYSATGAISLARKVFDEITQPDLVACNVMLGKLLLWGDLGAACRLFEDMPTRDVISWNTMIHRFAISGDLSAARELFERCPVKDMVSWSSMIAGYARRGACAEALALFQQWQAAGGIGDSKVDIGEKMGTAVMDLCAKCGDIDSALAMFRKMEKKDVFAWSAMIAGLASHGRAGAALELFSLMLSHGVKPNGGTFVAVLSACNHGGMVEAGRGFFSSIGEVHGISHSMEHYGCMVDLLGRAGHLQEAREVIMAMPFQPDAVIWRSLLGACRAHRNLEMAGEAAMEVMKMEPQVEGNYVLLCDVLAQGRKWDAVAGVRKMMKEKSLRKRSPGRSSIVIDGEVYGFFAGDQSHPHSNEIYRVLDGMRSSISRNVSQAVGDD
ncbi:pentatricopeptide repeat-containing protein At1g74630-like [Wolffia australiana]